MSGYELIHLVHLLNEPHSYTEDERRQKYTDIRFGNGACSGTGPYQSLDIDIALAACDGRVDEALKLLKEAYGR